MYKFSFEPYQNKSGRDEWQHQLGNPLLVVYSQVRLQANHGWLGLHCTIAPASDGSCSRQVDTYCDI